VYFQNADSSLVLAALTDENGTVGATVAPGGFVTAVHPARGSDAMALTTFAGVAPGDRLHVDLAPIDTRTAVDVGVSVATYAGAAAYQVHTSCGEIDLGSAATIASTQLIGCDGVADVIVVASDDSATPLAAFYQPGVAIVDGQTIALAGTYRSFAPTPLAYRGVPARVSFLKIYRALATARGRLTDGTTGVMPASGAANATLDEPVAAGTTSLTVTDATPGGSGLGEQLIYDWGPTPATPGYALDVAAAQLPSYAAAPHYDATAGAVTWAEQPGAIAPDFARVRVRVTRDAIPTYQTWTWRVIAPRGAAATVAYPKLPVDGFDFNIAANDITAIEDVTNVALPGGYDAFRARGFDDVATAITGSSGRMVVELL
jgi:hypothetical protein